MQDYQTCWYSYVYVAASHAQQRYNNEIFSPHCFSVATPAPMWTVIVKMSLLTDSDL